ncbi:MAG: response regulator [Candidatus Marinimicrobia bacterium]|nr:response regulator [Candidatus Neomarinimicrobiota bacterium]
MGSETKSVLIVEDDEDTAEILSEALQQLDYNVAAAVTNGADAIACVQENVPDIILMDIELLGDMDGVQTTREILMICEVPVVYLTGRTDDETLDKVKKTNPYGYIVKPFEVTELKVAIELALYKHDVEVGREKLITELQDIVANVVRQYIGAEKLGPNGKNWFG